MNYNKNKITEWQNMAEDWSLESGRIRNALLEACDTLLEAESKAWEQGYEAGFTDPHRGYETNPYARQDNDEPKKA